MTRKTLFSRLSLLMLPMMLVMFEHNAHAQRISKVNGKTLSSFCTDAKMVKACDAYISGIMDSEVFSRDYALLEHNKAPVAFCVPAEQTITQVRNLIVAWMGAHLDALNEPAGRGVYRALHENYPCQIGQEDTKNKK